MFPLYHPLINHLHSSYSTATFVNLSMSVLGIFRTSSESFLSMLTDLQLDDKSKKTALLKTMNIAVRCTYYIFVDEKMLDKPRFIYLLKCDPLDIYLTIIFASFLLFLFGCMYFKATFFVFILLTYCRLTTYTQPSHSEVYYCILNYIIMKFHKKLLLLLLIKLVQSLIILKTSFYFIIAAFFPTCLDTHHC